MSLIKQLLIIFPCTEVWIYLIKIQGMIPMIVLGLEYGRKHDGGETKTFDVVEFINNSLKVSTTKFVFTGWWYLPASIESINKQMIDSDIVKPVLHKKCFFNIQSFNYTIF